MKILLVHFWWCRCSGFPLTVSCVCCVCVLRVAATLRPNEPCLSIMKCASIGRGIGQTTDSKTEKLWRQCSACSRFKRNHARAVGGVGWPQYQNRAKNWGWPHKYFADHGSPNQRISPLRLETTFGVIRFQTILAKPVFGRRIWPWRRRLNKDLLVKRLIRWVYMMKQQQVLNQSAISLTWNNYPHP